MANRFVRRGNTDLWFISTLASPTAPSITTDIGGGVSLGLHVSEISGFSSTGTFVETPDFGSSVVSKIPGTDELTDSALTIYEYDVDADNPLKTTLAKGTSGYVLMAPHGGENTNGSMKVGQKVNVFPVQVASTSDNFDSGNVGATWTCSMAITSAPYYRVSVVT